MNEWMQYKIQSSNKKIDNGATPFNDKGPLPLTMDSCYIVPGEDLEFRYSIYLLSNDDVDAVFL